MTNTPARPARDDLPAALPRAEAPTGRPSEPSPEPPLARGEDQVEVGVGPWPGGRENWPTDARYDVELLEHGDRRNVVDAYRYWTVEAIVADMDARRPADRRLHVAIENWGHDLNIGSVVRTANAFNAAGVHIVGRRRWNRRGAMVTDRYQHVSHHPQVEDLLTWAAAQHDGAGIPVIGIDNVPGSIPIEGFAFPPECVLLFGQESSGLSAEARAASREILHITQLGSTRSINAGAAAAIAMHAWAVQHAYR
ncbi:TrmH family RNA methyltransferase [Oerskovia enterophila]|uniref:TrmH family RNA methyltransferase n=1 Tax=Oerskovia enterophila TaxID=43678 RepID=UPI0034804636